MKCEDILNKFFEALVDSNAKLAVEFNKNPKDIDETVDFVIQYKGACAAGKPDAKYGRTRAVNTNEEPEKKKRKQTNNGQGGKATGGNTDKACFHCGGLDHLIRDCPHRRPKGNFGQTCKPIGPCNTCKRIGHIARNCPQCHQRQNGPG